MPDSPESVKTNDSAVEEIASRLIGRMVGGFQVLSYVGGGAMSNVFKARQVSLNRIVAIKVLRKDIVDERTIKRLKLEASALTKIDHPNIVHVYAFDQDGENFFLAMDFVDGKSLAETLRDRGSIPMDGAIRITAQIADALAHSHDRAIIHRDIKPSNIMLVEDESGWTPRLVDFGLAKVHSDSAIMKLTNSNSPMGTPGYMSPEQCNSAVCDARSDVYSLGCVLYEMLMGVAPFTGDSAYAILYGHLTRLAPELPSARFPQWLQSVVARCLEKDPEKRFQSMQELADALRNSSRQKVRSQEQRSNSAKQLHKGRRVWTVFGALFVGGLVFLLWLSPQMTQRNQMIGTDELGSLIDKLGANASAAKRCPLLLKRAAALKKESEEESVAINKRQLRNHMTHDLQDALKSAMSAQDDELISACEKSIEQCCMPDEDAELRNDVLFDRAAMVEAFIGEKRYAEALADAQIIAGRLKTVMQKNGLMSQPQLAKAYTAFHHLVDLDDSMNKKDNIEPDLKLWREFEHRYSPDTLEESDALISWVQHEQIIHGTFNDEVMVERICGILKRPMPTADSERDRANQLNEFCTWTEYTGKQKVTLPLLQSILQRDRKSSEAGTTAKSDVNDRITAMTLRHLSISYLGTDADKAVKFARAAIERQKRFIPELNEQVSAQVALVRALIAKNDSAAMEQEFKRCTELIKKYPSKDDRYGEQTTMDQLLADFYFEKERYQDVISLLQQSLALQKADNERQSTPMFNTLARAYWKLKQYDKALSSAKSAQEAWDSPDHEPFSYRTVNTYEVLFDIYKDTGKPELAAEALDHAVTVLDSTYDLEPIGRKQMRDGYAAMAAEYHRIAKH